MAKHTKMMTLDQRRDTVLERDRLYPKSQRQLQHRFTSGKLEAHQFRNIHTWLVLAACRRARLTVSESLRLASA